MSYTLVISDPHLSPDQSLERFRAAGRMILAEKPYRLIVLGDLATLDSCTGHILPGTAEDHDRPSLADEAQICKESLSALFGPRYDYISRRKRHRHHWWKMDRVLVKGNHEFRWDRWANLHPAQASAINIDELLGFTKHFDTIVPYKESITFEHIDYTHVPINKMGRPMGGVSVCRTVCLQSGRHMIFGHSHQIQMATLGLLGGKNGVRAAIVAPAFMNRGNIEAYAKGTATGWSYGLMKVYPSPDPHEAPDIEFISMRRLLEQYGD